MSFRNALLDKISEDLMKLVYEFNLHSKMTYKPIYDEVIKQLKRKHLLNDIVERSKEIKFNYSVRCPLFSI